VSNNYELKTFNYYAGAAKYVVQMPKTLPGWKLKNSWSNGMAEEWQTSKQQRRGKAIVGDSSPSVIFC